MMLQTLEQWLASRPILFQLMRFACIGALNTALDFTLLNLLTESFAIQSGPGLWLLNTVGVVAAIIQSYIWNKHWAFANTQKAQSLFGQLCVLVGVGGLGFGVFVLSILPSLRGLLDSIFMLPDFIAPQVGYYIAVLLGFLLLQLIVTVHLGFYDHAQQATSQPSQFGSFALVSLVGVIINSTILLFLAWVLTELVFDLEASLAKNLAKFAAVFISLAWNFVGYKFFVFHR